MEHYHRQSLRLQGYDYARPGAYFVTLVAWRRGCRFGEIVDGEVDLSQEGRIVQDSWLRLPGFLPIRLDAWVIMPNHFHAVIWIEDRDDKAHLYGRSICPVRLHKSDSWRADASPQPIGTQPGSLGAIIQNFKSVTTRKINWQFGDRGAPIWQRNYSEHIIRNEEE